MAAEKKSSTPNRPFLRRIVVTLGPLEEWRGKSKGEIVQFKSDGNVPEDAHGDAAAVADFHL